LHENLYQSADLGRIDMRAYIDKLVSTLHRAYGDGRARFIAVVDRIFLPVDVAVPCGLIANELLTNALKHAFAEGSDGRSNAVRVEMRTSGDHLALSVADNGRGFPGDIDPTRDETMGLTLVRDLSSQLRGRIEFTTKGGARCAVTFPTPDRPLDR
jgi:two-component sensor histidine kinase